MIFKMSLGRTCKVIRILLFIFYVPICVLMLYSSLYSSYITYDTWNCQQLDGRFYELSANGTHIRKCETIIDNLQSFMVKYITQEKVLMLIRTCSLYNTFFTYISASFATYKIIIFPLIWLATVSVLSFFVTVNFTIIYGPLSGINNFELVPTFLHLNIQPYITTGSVLVIDMSIAILVLLLVLNEARKRIKIRRQQEAAVPK